MHLVFRRITRATILVGTPLLVPFDRWAVRRALKSSERRPNPVFIIGVPRSGSTLLYKVFAGTFGFAFFSNMSSQFWRTPYLGMLLSKLVGVKPSRGLESRYGTFKGVGDPHEFGSFWYRWFRGGLDVHTVAGELPQSAIEEIRNEVFAASILYGRPILFKNLFNTMRVAALAECFPGAVFIVCQRDPVQNALSLLKGRIENKMDQSGWWTVPPKEVRSLLGRPLPEQVAGQVYYVSKQLDDDMAKIGPERFFVVSYEEFCADVHGTLYEAASFFKRHRYDLAFDLSKVPPRFESRDVRGLGRSDEVAVERALALFQGE